MLAKGNTIKKKKRNILERKTKYLGPNDDNIIVWAFFVCSPGVCDGGVGVRRFNASVWLERC
jgi:hypothetical protein